MQSLREKSLHLIPDTWPKTLPAVTLRDVRRSLPYLALAAGTYITYKVSRTIYKVFFHTPEVSTARINKLDVPPSDFDLRAVTRQATLDIVSREHPELLDIATAGLLIAYEPKQRCPHVTSDVPSTIWLVGTTHVDDESPVHVQRVIKAVAPADVMVELDAARVGILSPQRQAPAAQDGIREKLEKIKAMSQRVGFTSAAVLVLLGSIYQSAEVDLEALTGRDMLAAYTAAKELKRELGRPCPLILGDRPVLETIKALWAALTPWQRLGVCWMLVFGKIKFDREMLDLLKECDIVDFLMNEVSSHYPEAVHAVVHDRDWFLAAAAAVCPYPGENESSTQPPPADRARVVVVGRAHLRGMVYVLDRLLPRLYEYSFKVLPGPAHKLLVGPMEHHNAVQAVRKVMRNIASYQY